MSQPFLWDNGGRIAHVPRPRRLLTVRVKGRLRMNDLTDAPPDCSRCDGYGMLASDDWLTAAQPCPDCAEGAKRAAEDSCAEQDRATGAAFRRLVENGERFAVVYMDAAGGTIGVELAGCGRDFALTLPEAVFKALGPERR